MLLELLLSPLETVEGEDKDEDEYELLQVEDFGEVDKFLLVAVLDFV